MLGYGTTNFQTVNVELKKTTVKLFDSIILPPIKHNFAFEFDSLCTRGVQVGSPMCRERGHSRPEQPIFSE